MRKIPAIKHVATNTGILWVCIQIRLHAMSPNAVEMSDVLVENRNFSRNMMVKVSAKPTNEA